MTNDAVGELTIKIDKANGRIVATFSTNGQPLASYHLTPVQANKWRQMLSAAIIVLAQETDRALN